MNGCLEVLHGLGKTVRVELIAHRLGYAGSPSKRILRLSLGTNAPSREFEVRTTGSRLSEPLASKIIEESKRAPGPCLVCAPYVPLLVGNRLAAHRVSYVDMAGNCHIEPEGLLIAHVEGKRRIRHSPTRPSGIKAHQLLFAFLAEPELVEAPVRKIALEAGLGKSATLELLGALRSQGLLDCNPGERRLHKARVLLERWLTVYAEVVRPSWLVARCKPTATEPRALEALVERECEGYAWAFGGSAAASRMIAMDRGVETILHMTEIPPDVMGRLKAVPSANGPLTILHTPGRLAYRGTGSHLAHPLLVYTELLTSTAPQSAQAASALREQFLAELEPFVDSNDDQRLEGSRQSAQSARCGVDAR